MKGQVSLKVIYFPQRIVYFAMPIGAFHVTSYKANFASHHTRDRHVGFQFTCEGIGKSNKMYHYFLFSSYHITKLQPSDKNINTHTRMKFQILP